MRLPLIITLILATNGMAEPPHEFAWESITPSLDLAYHDCYQHFRCARLIVPLDYKNDTDTRTTAIAIIKYPSVVAETEPSFGGSIFVNPGGPGSSGVSFLRKKASGMQQVLDRPDRHYELISFDPRGVGNSSPRVDCFPDVASRQMSAIVSRAVGALYQDGSEHALSYLLTMQRAVNQGCDGNHLAYMNTPSVARDMVEMVDKVEALRETQGDRLFELRKRRHELPRLQYIGFSYGGVLGNYFASMFPGRVGRMILDGAGDAIDYSTGPGYLSNLADADTLFDEFFRGCHQAGPVCALFRTKDDSYTDISRRFHSWLAHLGETPLSILHQGSTVVVTSQDVRRLVFDSIYKPMERFKTLAQSLAQAMDGNMTLLVSNLGSVIPDLGGVCSNKTPGVFPEQESAFVCADGDDVSGNSVAWWRRYVNTQTDTSGLFGAYWATIRMTCYNWSWRPNWVFKGPFTTPEVKLSLSGAPIAGHPAAPVLFLSNRLDPVSPLAAARRMAHGHPGAGLVIQEALGHCVFGVGPSKCAKAVISDYLAFGTVPDGEMICEGEGNPWI